MLFPLRRSRDLALANRYPSTLYLLPNSRDVITSRDGRRFAFQGRHVADHHIRSLRINANIRHIDALQIEGPKIFDCFIAPRDSIRSRECIDGCQATLCQCEIPIFDKFPKRPFVSLGAGSLFPGLKLGWLALGAAHRKSCYANDYEKFTSAHARAFYRAAGSMARSSVTIKNRYSGVP